MTGTHPAVNTFTLTVVVDGAAYETSTTHGIISLDRLMQSKLVRIRDQHNMGEADFNKMHGAVAAIIGGWAFGGG